MSGLDFCRYPVDDLISCNIKGRAGYDQVDDFRKILKRFTKAELSYEILQICGLNMDLRNHNTRMDKEQLVEYIIREIQHKSIDVEEAATLLKLKYCQTHVKSRQWCVTEIKSAKKLIDRNTMPETFAIRLKKYLNRSQISCLVTSQVEEDTMWTVVSIKKIRSKPDIFFLLTYPHLPFVLHSNIKAAIQDVVHRGLLQLFKGTNVEKLPVKSKNIDTLVLFGCQKSARHVDPTLLPAIARKKEKRLVEEKDVMPENIVDEDFQEELARKAYVKKAFGTYKSPALETLTYVVTSDFYGFDDDDNPHTPTVCQAVFKGQNVLEGVQQLVKSGIGKYPLPDHMANVPESGCNKFRIKIRKT